MTRKLLENMGIKYKSGKRSPVTNTVKNRYKNTISDNQNQDKKSGSSIYTFYTEKIDHL
jgi:hypothetical protein